MQSFLVFLVYSTLFLLAGGGVVGLLLRFSGCQSPAWNRFVWAFVMLLGVTCFRMPLEIPVLTQQQPLPASQAIAPAVIPAAPQSDNITKSPIPAARAWSEFFASHAIHLIFAGWLCGAALFFAAQLFFWHSAVRQAKNATVPEEFFQSEWERLLAVYGLDSRKIELRTVEGAGPGLLRLPGKSIVVVPTAIWEEAPEHVRIGILKHEISHYRHNDLWKSLVLRAVALLHWFNPMAHYAVRKFDEAAEWRCDADAFGGAENAFAETMLLLRDTMPVSSVCRTAFSANNIKRRGERLIQFTQHKGDSLMKKTLIALCCAAMLLFGVFEIRLTAQSPVGNPETLDISQPNVEIEARIVLALPDYVRDTAAFQFGSVNQPSNQTYLKLPNRIDLSLLDAAIADGESKGYAQLLFQPKFITPNNSSAGINSSIRFTADRINGHDNAISIKFNDAEQKLTVTPHIIDNDKITLDISFVMKITNSGYTLSGGSTGVSTSVLASDGETAIFGGMPVTIDGDTRELLIFVAPRIMM